MRIPQEIKDVPRPKNTVIRDYFGVYKVVKRTSKYINKKPIPIDIAILGEIKDLKYVPFEEPIPIKQKENTITPLVKSQEESDIKDYGNITLFTNNSKDILDSLLKHFDNTTALKLYAIAIIRCSYPRAVNRDLLHYYRTSYLSELIKNVGLSETSLPDFFEQTGRHYSSIENFMLDRINLFKGKVQIIDGTLKTYNAQDSFFSAWSRKGKIKGSKDFSLLYTYDLTTKEPIYHRPYEGNMLDSTIFDDYIENIKGNNEILIGDKGFRTEYIINKLAKINALKYLFPIKNTLSIINENNFISNLQSIKIKDKDLLGRKIKLDNKFYYVIKDLDIESVEKKNNLKKYAKSIDFNYEDFELKSKKFGVIIFESNVDLSLEEVYVMYNQRWEIESMFNFYKNILELSPTRVHSDMKVYTTEFINYLSLIIGCRVKNLIVKKGLNTKYSFKQIIEYLKSYKKQFVNSIWRDTKVLKYVKELANNLDI